MRTEFDSSADFKAFHTYAIAELTDVDQGSVLKNPVTRQRLESMIVDQLSKKGLRQVEEGDHPDLLVHYGIGLRPMHRMKSNSPTGGLYGWRDGYEWGSGYGTASTYEFTEGTLIVDLVASGRNELVWRGTIVATRADTREKNFQLVHEGIAKAFENYPPKMNTP